MQLTATRTILREALVERFERSMPRIVVLAAPAGFGKSTAVRQLAARFERHAVVDLGGRNGASPATIANAILAGLGNANPPGASDIAVGALSLGNVGSEQWYTRLRALWQYTPAQPTMYVIENAAAGHRGALAPLLEVLLPETPPTRTVAIVSREHVPLPVGKNLLPYDILRITAADLRFSEAEIRSVLPADMSEAMLRRLVVVSQGWPIAVMYLAALHERGELGDMLNTLDDATLGELSELLLDAVVDSLSADDRHLLSTCALSAGASFAECNYIASTEIGPNTFRESSPLAPFVRLEGDLVEVHPLLRAAIRRRFPKEARQAAIEVAQAARSAGDRVRAAKLYLDIGMHEAAIACIEGTIVPYVTAPTPQLAEIVAGVDLGLLSRFPSTWAGAFVFREYTAPWEQLIEEARAVYLALSDSVSPTVRAGVLTALVNALLGEGRVHECTRYVDEFERSLPATGSGREAEIVETWRDVLNVFSGRYRGWDVRGDLHIARLASNDAAIALVEADVATLVMLARGEFAAARLVIEGALRRARAGPIPAVADAVFSMAIFGSVLSGDLLGAREFARQLDAELVPPRRDGWQRLIDAALDRPLAPDSRVERARTRFFAPFVAAASEPARDRRAILVAQCERAAEACGDPFFITLATLVSVSPGTLNEEAALRARRAAGMVDSLPLQAAVNAWFSNGKELGMLRPLAEQLAFATPKRATPSVAVGILDGIVRVNGRSLDVPAREMLLLAALAIERGTIGSARLAGMLWPDVEEAHAQNSLRVYVKRVRKRLGDDTVIRSAHGYTLGRRVEVDVWKLEHDLQCVRSGRAEEAIVGKWRELLMRPLPPLFANLDWFQPAAHRLENAARELAEVG